MSDHPPSRRQAQRQRRRETRRQRRYLKAGPPLRDRISSWRSRLGRRTPHAPVFVSRYERFVAGLVAVLAVFSVGFWWATRTTLPGGSAAVPVVSPGPTPTLEERPSPLGVPNPSPDPGPQNSPR